MLIGGASFGISECMKLCNATLGEGGRGNFFIPSLPLSFFHFYRTADGSKHGIHASENDRIYLYRREKCGVVMGVTILSVIPV